MPGKLPPAGLDCSTYIQHPCSGPHDDGVSPQEEIKCLLDVWKEIHVSRRKVRSDEWCMMYPSDNLTAHHVWSVEAREINVPSLLSLPCNQSYCNQHRKSVDKDFWADHVRVQAWFLLL